MNLYKQATSRYKNQLNPDIDYKRFRNGSRINFTAQVMIKSNEGGEFHSATMHNFSSDGMYCSSAIALKPNEVITVMFDAQPFKWAPKVYVGEIKRCEVLKGAGNSLCYGLGIKIIQATDDINKLTH